MEDNSIDSLSFTIKTNADEACDGINRFVKSLEGLKSATTGMNVASNRLKKLADSIAALGSATKDGNKVAANLKKIQRTLGGVSGKAGKVDKSMSSLSRTMGTGLKIGGMIYLAKRLGRAFGSMTADANEYLETINLFEVSFGELTGKATQFSNRISEALGINPAEIQKNLATFMDLSKAIGMTADQAYTVSTNMTQLAYDIASLKNISFDASFLKLKSALVGEIEPIRAIGYDINKARLQTELYTMGINKNVDSLTQSDKAMLRYIVLMKQTTAAQGDMAKTLMSPANAIRVLKSLLEQLSRSIGYIFIPMLQTVLPYVQALTKSLTDLAMRIATFFGFDISKFNYGGSTFENISGGFEDVADAENKAAKKLKSFTAGFDELNVINGTSSISGDLGGLSALGDIKLPEYDMLEHFIPDGKTEEIKAFFDAIVEGFSKIVDMPGFSILSYLFTSLWEAMKPLIDYVAANPEQLGEWIARIADALIILAMVKGLYSIVTALTAISEIDLLPLLTNLGKMAGVALVIWGALELINDSIDIFSGEGKGGLEDVQKVLEDIGLIVSGIGLFMGGWEIAILGVVLALSGLLLPELMLGFAWIERAVIYLASWVVDFVWDVVILGIATSIKMAIENTIVFFKNSWVKSVKFVLDQIDKSINFFVSNINTLISWLNTVFKIEIEEIPETTFKLDYANDHPLEKYNFDYASTYSAMKEEHGNTWGPAMREYGKTITDYWGEEYNKSGGITDRLKEVSEKLGLNKETLDENKITNAKLKEFADTYEENSNATNEQNKVFDNSVLNKMDGIENACRNIRIEVINNYGAEKKANGGFVGTGSLFIAGEAGPEMVGSIGGRSAVANTGQMTSALYQGVYGAMSDILNQNNSNRPIQINSTVTMPDGRVLASAVAEGQLANGYNLGLGGFNV